MHTSGVRSLPEVTTCCDLRTRCYLKPYTLGLLFSVLVLVLVGVLPVGVAWWVVVFTEFSLFPPGLLMRLGPQQQLPPPPRKR